MYIPKLGFVIDIVVRSISEVNECLQVWNSKHIRRDIKAVLWYDGKYFPWEVFLLGKCSFLENITFELRSFANSLFISMR